MSQSSRRPTGASEDEALLAELIEDCVNRLQAGGQVDLDVLARAHPAYAAQLRQLLPALEVLADLGEEAGTGGKPAPNDLAAEVPGQLGDFRVLREVGRGGMGVVYEAEQVSLGRRVALKVLQLAATMDPRRLQRFHNEARAAASLHHEHIVPVYAVGQERGVHFYAMQFIEGQTLAEVIAGLRDGRPSVNSDQPSAAYAQPPGTALLAAATVPGGAQTTSPMRQEAAPYYWAAGLIAQAAEALEQAHVQGVVHRDIKPANLMIDGQGKLWVTDFGLARLGADTGLTMAGDVLGTLRYLSPEQALARHGLVDHRTDVYALGATLYELLTLRPAIDGQDREEILHRIAFEEPRLLRQVDRRIPADLETITLKALAKEPTERYATAQELAEDLGRFLGDQPIRARRPILLQRLRKWGRRHWAALTAAMIGLVVTLATLIGSIGWVLGDRAARQREAENKVLEALEAAKPGLRQGNPWDPALISAVQQAEAQLNGGLVGQDIRRRVEQLQKDAQMLAELERIRLDQGSQLKENFDRKGSAAQYARAFRGYGIDVEALEGGEAASLVQGSAIREHLVAGLDDWADVLALDATEEGRQKAQQVLAVAQQVDPDAWRSRLRQMVLSRDTRDLEELARAAPVEKLPAATLGLVGQWAWYQGKTPGPLMELLRRAQRRFPADFWINHQLAYALTRVQPPRLEEATGFYRVALALRPQSPGVHLNLGLALHDKGDQEGAIAAYREALRLQNHFVGAHNNLGNALRDQGNLDEAIAEYQKAIEINNDIPGAHNNLGLALRDKGDLDGAIAAYRRAVRLQEDYGAALLNLGLALREKGDLDGAIAAYRQAVRFQMDHAEAHVGLGNALRAKGDLDGAIAAYREAFRIKKDYAEAHSNLGLALRDQGAWEASLNFHGTLFTYHFQQEVSWLIQSG